MKLENYFLVIFFLAIISGCSICDCKKIPCPAYVDPLFDAWFPYASNDQLIFKTATGEADSFLLKVFKSEAYETQRGCSGGNQDCRATGNFTSINPSGIYDNKINFSEEITELLSGQQQKITRFIIFETSYMGYGMSDTGLIKVPDNNYFRSQFYTSLTLNSRTFNQVQSLEYSNIQTTPGVYKFYISKNAGLVAYETYPALKLWVKQN